MLNGCGPKLMERIGRSPRCGRVGSPSSSAFGLVAGPPYAFGRVDRQCASAHFKSPLTQKPRNGLAILTL